MLIKSRNQILNVRLCKTVENQYGRKAKRSNFSVVCFHRCFRFQLFIKDTDILNITFFNVQTSSPFQNDR